MYARSKHESHSQGVALPQDFRQIRKFNAPPNNLHIKHFANSHRRVASDPSFKLPSDINETFYEKTEPNSYKVVIRDPGKGFEHVVTADEINARINAFPENIRSGIIRELAAVQLSSVGKKNRNFFLYGLQWGPGIYLFPMPERDPRGLYIEYFTGSPRSEEVAEYKRFGGVLSALPQQHGQPPEYCLKWRRADIKDYYTECILVHELGHLIDNRNQSFAEREAFANHFALQYGRAPHTARPVRRRHHKNAYI